MARQKGLLIIEGTIGGLNFYIRKGGIDRLEIESGK
jgi:hypothetical protein